MYTNLVISFINESLTFFSKKKEGGIGSLIIIVCYFTRTHIHVFSLKPICPVSQFKQELGKF